MSEVALWALLAAGLLVTEALTLALVALMLTGGALVGLALAAAGAPGSLQLVGFAASSALLVVAVRPVARRHLEVRALPNDPGAALVGQEAVVTAEVHDGAGQVRVHGELWTARPAVEGDVLPAGSRVFIAAVSGAVVTVYPSDLDHR